MPERKFTVKPSLTTRGLSPENQETPLEYLQTDTMNNYQFFRRNHFDYPALNQANYRLLFGRRSYLRYSSASHRFDEAYSRKNSRFLRLLRSFSRRGWIIR